MSFSKPPVVTYDSAIALIGDDSIKIADDVKITGKMYINNRS